eukprot:2400472-Alexandrium_andersonii.AAC.1
MGAAGGQSFGAPRVLSSSCIAPESSAGLTPHLKRHGAAEGQSLLNPRVRSSSRCASPKGHHRPP